MESTFDTFQHVQKRIDHDRIWFCVSIACIAIGLILILITKIDLESDLLSRVSLLLGIFMLAFGGMFAWQLWKQIEYSVEHYHELNRAQLSAYRLANKLPLPAYEIENIQAHQPEPIEPPQPVNIIKEVLDDKGRISSWQIENHPDRPSLDFLEIVFKAKDEAGMIPTERELAQMGKNNGSWTSTQSNRWLTMFEQAGIADKVTDTQRGNARRYFKRGLTLNQLRETFKYPMVSL